MTIFEEVASLMPREIRRAMDQAIAEGLYETHGEILSNAAHLWMDQFTLRNAKNEQMRAMLDEARKSPSVSSEKVFAELRERIAARVQQATAAE